MADRLTMREISEARTRIKLEEMQVAIDEGRLTVRQMTPRERKASDAHRAEAARKRAARSKRGG